MQSLLTTRQRPIAEPELLESELPHAKPFHEAVESREQLTGSHAAHFQDKDDIDYAFSKGGGPALDVQVSRKTPLDVRVGFRPTSFANVLGVEGLPASVARRAPQISVDDGQFLGVLFQKAGRTVCFHKDRQLVVDPGEVTLWHGRRSFEFRMPGRFQKLCLIVPIERFESILPGSELHAGAHFPAKDALSQLLSSWLGALAEAVFRVDDQTSATLVGVTLDMLAAAMTRSKESVCVAPRTTLFARVRAYIDRRLDEPDLFPANIAAAHHISLRYLHFIFNERGLTVGGWIRMRRLDQCRAALTDRRRDRSITEIALNWGFSDAAHFSRSFRAAFGTSPREYRRRVFRDVR